MVLLFLLYFCCWIIHEIIVMKYSPMRRWTDRVITVCHVHDMCVCGQKLQTKGIFGIQLNLCNELGTLPLDLIIFLQYE